ncbi:FAD-linked oxidoreductase oxr2 [Pyricularia grisea]|nr:FAD-linked oxidoreductase oxr2 [Pyricularia grisea]
MKSFTLLASAGLATLASLPLTMAGVITPSYFDKHPLSRRQISDAQVQRELGPQLSRNATIIGPGGPGWDDAIERFDNESRPTIRLVVVPGVESDIATVVKLANRFGVPFLVKNRGHALTNTIGKFRGIQIDMSRLTKITIQPGEPAESAWFQGGAWDKQAIEYLWDRGYVTVTGSCDCVGMMGPGLGGGHGRYQGLYGLISDNLINMNVVLADGSAVRVNATSNPDLWWGMQGAGHNLGIVTSFQSKIYPRKIDTWHYHSYTYTQDKLEAVFEALNTFHGNGDGSTPVLMALNTGGFYIDPSVSQTEPVVSWVFGYAGPAEEAEALLEPFNRLKPAAEQSGDVPYPEVATAMGTGQDQPLCQPGDAHVQVTSQFNVYNVTAERALYQLFNRTIAEHPQLADSVAFHEGYSTAAVDRVDPNASAVAFRDRKLLMFFDTRLTPANAANPEVLKMAREFGRQVRRIWNEGAPDLKPATYVNYAAGDEPLESMYGYEPARLKRLREIKRKYDPHGRFVYYNPIA